MLKSSVTLALSILIESPTARTVAESVSLAGLVSLLSAVKVTVLVMAVPPTMKSTTAS